MGWDAAAAVGSIAGAFILLGGTVAAIVQLRHLRLTYQIESYLDIMQRLTSNEMVEAREFVESQDFSDPDVLAAALENGIDKRIMLYGGLCQTVSRLINLGVLDRTLFASFTVAATTSWRALRPIAHELRKRDGSNLRWMDVETLVYHSQFDLYPERIAPRRYYPQALMASANLNESLERARHAAAEVSALPDKA